MIEYIKKRNVQWLLVAIVGFLLPISSVSAQTTDCCLLNRQGTYTLDGETSIRGTYTIQGGDSCIVASPTRCATERRIDSGNCTNEDVPFAAAAVIAQKSGSGLRLTQAEAEDLVRRSTCRKNIQNQGQAVSCTSNMSLCQSAISAETTCRAFGKGACNQNPDCFWDERVCQNRYDNSICSILPLPLCSGNEQGSKACIWSDVTNACVTVVEKQLGDQYAVKETGTILPACAFTGSCRSVDDLLVVAINATKKIFGIMGAIAFGFFVYGGVTIILSFGNGDKVKKGRDVLVASVVGIIIAFSAYFMVGYILNSLNVGSNFNYGNINTTVQ